MKEFSLRPYSETSEWECGDIKTKIVLPYGEGESLCYKCKACEGEGGEETGVRHPTTGFEEFLHCKECLGNGWKLVPNGLVKEVLELMKVEKRESSAELCTEHGEYNKSKKQFVLPVESKKRWLEDTKEYTQAQDKLKLIYDEI